MIKLIRGAKPAQLTDDICSQLTDLYKRDKKDVWNDVRIKEPLRNALLDMSQRKCCYCECRIAIESKDVTVEHFLPKKTYSEKVLEWENLFPACLRCNRTKRDQDDKIVNPCENEPKKYLALCSENLFRLKGIDDENVGKNTIRIIKLNDIERVVVPRMQEWENISERLQELWDDIQESGYQEKYRKRLKILMGKCTRSNSYAAVKATNMLNNTFYIRLKRYLIENNRWGDLEVLENGLREIALTVV